MVSSRLPGQPARLIVGVSFLALTIAACNKQPTATEAPMVAPPIAALPLAAGTPPAQSPAPVGAALPAPSMPIRYAPLPPSEGYGYIDQAYSMGQAFADTPPDYSVDYEGTRPWVWRAGDGSYRIVERLPQGERYFYYRSGQDYPFLVRDPDYSYAYDNGDLVAVYGADGAELDGAFAARRADEASRYLYRARELYRAAQYQQRQSAYANEWGGRQDQFRHENLIWQQQQAQNAGWHSWHEAHQAQEQQQWLPERNHRVAYAAAIGLGVAASRAAAPDPVQLSRRQAAYFSNWSASHGHAPTSGQATASNTIAAPQARTAPPVAAKGGVAANQPATIQKTAAAPVQTKVAEAAQVQKQAAQAKQREFAAARASSAQAARDQQLAAQAQQREAAAARIKAAQAARAEKLAAQAKQHEAAAAQATIAAQTTQAQKGAVSAKRNEATAAEAKAAQAARNQKAVGAEVKQRQAAAAQAQAARAEKSAAEAKQREAGAARAQAEQAARAEKSAAQAKQHEAAAAQAQAAQAARAEKSAAEEKQRETRAAQSKAAQESHARPSGPEAPHGNPPPTPAAKKPDHSKRKPPKDQGDQPQ